MKKTLLIIICIVSWLNLEAQVREAYPENFSKAVLPDEWRNRGSKVSIGHQQKQDPINQSIPLKKPEIVRQSSSLDYLIGLTFYDLQTNHSVNNSLSINNDGTVSAVWTFSPNSTSGFPVRGHGYNYFDGSNWIFSGTTPQVHRKHGFPNIVVTPAGREMIISHTDFDPILNTDSTTVSVLWRSVKGAQDWDTLLLPWGDSTYYTHPKACGGLTNENVYVIFQKVENPVLAMTPSYTIEGGNGPIYFSKSTDGGFTWTPASMIGEIGPSFYRGFNADSYSIDAKGDTIAITFGDAFTDLGLLKSTDGGNAWSKFIIQQHPIPFYDPVADLLSDVNNDGIADTISTNGSDSKVLIDNDGMCHVWFSEFRYLNDTVGDGDYTAFYLSDNLFYWNEAMNQVNGYVAIVSTPDLDGNGVLTLPTTPITICNADPPIGFYGGGITQMPSAGIDNSGNIFIAFQTINERADTMFYQLGHRHVFMMVLPYPYTGPWSSPYDIVPSAAQGGDGENQDGVFACIARRIVGSEAAVLYHRDGAPGHALATAGTCDLANNFGNSTDVIFCTQDISVILSTVGVKYNADQKIIVSQNYPNPADGITRIDIQSSRNIEIVLEVFDIVGKRVLNNKFDVRRGNNSIGVDVSEWVKGVYFYSISLEKKVIVKKMIVN